MAGYMCPKCCAEEPENCTCSPFLTGAETLTELRKFEENAPPGDLDRFGRSRRVMNKLAENARRVRSLDAFFFWWSRFIAYTSEVRKPSVSGDPRTDQALLAGYGLAGEGGEVNDVIKKVFFHDKDTLDTMSLARTDKLMEEWGDRFWYDGQLADVLSDSGDLGKFFRGVIQGNMDKLTVDPRKH